MVAGVQDNHIQNTFHVLFPFAIIQLLPDPFVHLFENHVSAPTKCGKIAGDIYYLDLTI